MTICSAIQMVSSGDVAENLTEADRLIAAAAQAGAKLVVLPENFPLMGENISDKLAHRETQGQGPIQRFLAETSKKYAVWIIAGTIPLAADADHKVRAACLLYNDQGQYIARYDKIHLFDVDVPGTTEVYRESDTIEAGNTPLVVETPFGKIGFAVCYDLRFPEMFRAMHAQGVEVLVFPAAFTAQTGAAHWEVLLRARAIENQCYVIAPNQGGTHSNGRQTFGHSMIIDPWGQILDCHKSEPGIAIGNIDLDKLHNIRLKFPVLQHRRF